MVGFERPVIREVSSLVRLGPDRGIARATPRARARDSAREFTVDERERERDDDDDDDDDEQA